MTKFEMELKNQIEDTNIRNNYLINELNKRISNVNRNAMDYFSVCCIKTLDEILVITKELIRNSQEIYFNSQYFLIQD